MLRQPTRLSLHVCVCARGWATLGPAESRSAGHHKIPPLLPLALALVPLAVPAGIVLQLLSPSAFLPLSQDNVTIPAGGKNPKNILRISLQGTYHKDRVHRKKTAESIKMFSAWRGETHTDMQKRRRQVLRYRHLPGPSTGVRSDNCSGQMFTHHVAPP